MGGLDEGACESLAIEGATSRLCFQVLIEGRRLSAHAPGRRFVAFNLSLGV